MGQSLADTALKTPRIYLDPPLQEGQQVALDSATSHHLMRVLRLQVGQMIIVCDGQGTDYRATLLPARGQGKQQQVWVELGSSAPNQSESSKPLQLGVAPIQGERFERMLEQLAELGVASITPVICERSNVRQVNDAKLQRWRRVALEACQLAGRGVPLRIHAAVRFHQFVQSDRKGCLLHQEGQQKGRHGFDFDHLLIGPEGGFTSAEIQLGQSRNWQAWSLGERNLRVETAALVGAVWILQD